MAGKDLSQQVAKTYKMLRLGLAILAFGLPPLLSIGGYLLGDLPLADSMSAYYHAPGPYGQGVMRNEFVGVLFAVSGLLLIYQGFSKLEDYALNLAGILVLGVAVFPMDWPSTTGHVNFSLHGACAVLFFVSIAYVCIWRAGDTLPLVKDQSVRAGYERAYRYLGWAMVILPFVAWALSSILSSYTSAIFFVEASGIYVFATYWVVKSREASRTGLDQKAADGRVQARPDKLGDALRPLPVTVSEAEPQLSGDNDSMT